MDISLSWIYFCRIGNGFCGWNISETGENGYLSRNLFDRYGEKSYGSAVCENPFRNRFV